jgi:4-amino-4-deoxy-L-arabinose transferase-like glycosyltransferase
VLAWLALAASMQIGGPMSALWPLAGIALYVRLARPVDVWRRLQPVPGLLAIVGLSLPWYGAMIERHGGAFLGQLPAYPFGAGPTPPSPLALLGMPFAAITMLIAGGFPWSAILPGAAMHAAAWWRPRRPARGATVAANEPSSFVLAEIDDQVRQESAAHLLIAWLACALIPMAFVYRPPLSAALPAFPAMAALVGRLLDHLLESPERVRQPLHAGTRMLGLVGVPLAILAAMAASRLPEGAASLRLLSAALVVTVCAPFLSAFIGRLRVAALLFALPVAVAAPIVSLRVLPELEEYLSVRTVGESLREAAPERAALVLLEPPPSSLRYYAPRNYAVVRIPENAPLAVRGSGAIPSRQAPPAHDEELTAALERFRASDSTTYVAFRPWREDVIVHAARGPLEILARTPAMVLARVHPG